MRLKYVSLQGIHFCQFFDSLASDMIDGSSCNVQFLCDFKPITAGDVILCDDVFLTRFQKADVVQEAVVCLPQISILLADRTDSLLIP